MTGCRTGTRSTCPTRGPMLRDQYVLRLIAIDRAIHVIVLTTLAIILYTFARHDATLHRDYVNIMSDLSGTTPGESQVRGILGYLGRAFKYSPARLIQLGLLVTAYAALEATEMVGLWFVQALGRVPDAGGHRGCSSPRDLRAVLSVSVFKVVTLVINVAIAVYLLLAKRLFGLRGGHRVQLERHREFSGWPAIERTTPAFPASVSLDRGSLVPPGHRDSTTPSEGGTAVVSSALTGRWRSW